MSRPSTERTIAIKEKASGKVVVYEELQTTQSQWDAVWKYFYEYIDAIILDVTPGEEREYLLFFRNNDGRPICIEAKLIYKELVCERSVTGRPGPGAIEIVPYRFDNKPPFFAKKGTFPARPGAEPSVLADDGGMDEDAIIGALRTVHQVLQTAISEEFGLASQPVLIAALGALMRSTGASGILPRTDCLLDDSAEGQAMFLYDIALSLWLQSSQADDLPEPMQVNHMERLRDDDHNKKVLGGVAMYRRGM